MQQTNTLPQAGSPGRQFNWKALLAQNEFLVGLTIVVLSLVIGAINPNFFSPANIFGILRNSIVLGIFAMGVLVVLISGGIDVSFPAVAVFALYATTVYLRGIDYGGPVIVAFLIAAAIGLGLGMINAIFIALFRLPTLIVTLGTLSLIRGFMLFFVGSEYIRDVPQGMSNFSYANLIEVEAGRGTAAIPVAFLFLVAVSVLVWLVLRYTMLGRGIYAMGGDREAAERAGFNIMRIQFIIYGFVGLLAGVGGMVFGSMLRQANPFSIVGTELDVIAAVVLGGASISGGRGTVHGTLLGVLLITLINNSLILIGIPSIWQKVVIGVLIILGTGIPALQNRASGRKLSNAMLD